MAQRKTTKVEHVWHEPCDRWIYIKYYDDNTIGLNYCQGNDYAYFRQHYCKVDEGLTEFYEVMCVDYNIEKMSNTRIQFMSKVMWTYHTATVLSDDVIEISSVARRGITSKNHFQINS